MSGNQHQTTDDSSHTLTDKVIFWMFLAGSVFCVGLGTWALFFAA